MRRVPPLTMLWTMLMLAGLSACGYSPEGVYPGEYRTIALPIFENQTFYHRAQFDLGEALSKELEQRTPYKVVPEGQAQTLLSGRIRSIEQRSLGRRPGGGVPEEMEMTVVIDFTWEDLESGQILRQRQGFASVGRYAPTAPFGQPVELGQQEALQQAARDIVATLQSRW